MALLDDIRTVYMRIKNTATDTEILDLIAAAKLDLVGAGVDPNIVDDTTDPLIKRAIVLYVKANYGWDNADAAALAESYLSLKKDLAIRSDYREVG